MVSKPAYRALFIDAGEQMTCGVGQFSRLLKQSLGKSEAGVNTIFTLTQDDGSVSGLWRAVGSAGSVVCNFPIVAWKRVVLRPLLALAFAKLRGCRVVLVQHEWGGLNWMRRMTYLPALLLADAIVMFSPLVKQELADDRLVGWTARKCIFAPLPPNIAAPASIADSELRRRLAAARKSGRLVVGHFGSIYPGKQPNALLEIGALLRARGLDPLIVYIGSFIRGTDNIELEFHARAAELGLADDVIVSGYVESDAAIFGLFGEVDAFCYLLDEGLTARRASILTVVQSGRPVVVTEPTLPDEFAHHPRFRQLINSGAVSLVTRGADHEAYADRIVAATRHPSAITPFDFDGWWYDVTAAVEAQL